MVWCNENIAYEKLRHVLTLASKLELMKIEKGESNERCCLINTYVYRDEDPYQQRRCFGNPQLKLHGGGHPQNCSQRLSAVISMTKIDVKITRAEQQ